MLRVDQVVKNIKYKISEKLIASGPHYLNSVYPLKGSKTFDSVTLTGHYLVGEKLKTYSPYINTRFNRIKYGNI